MQLGDLGGLPAVLTTEQAAEVYGCSVDHLWQLARERRAPVEPLRLGRALRWPTTLVLRSIGVEAADADAF